MQKKQIYCTQCGAVIPPGEARCQYCGSSYAPEAEKEYMRRLDQVRRDLEKVGNVGAETSRTESGRVRRRVLRILVTILVLSAAVYGLFLYQQRRGISTGAGSMPGGRKTCPSLTSSMRKVTMKL